MSQSCGGAATSRDTPFTLQMNLANFHQHIGRRWTLIGGNLVNMLTFIIATILLAKYPPGANDNKAAAWGFIVTTWAYNVSFSAACGPLSWIIPAEVRISKYRVHRGGGIVPHVIKALCLEALLDEFR